MKNIAKNTLKYTGIVTISQVIGKKKIELAKVHNRGSNSLFNFLSDCLIGDFDTARLDRPTKIMLLQEEHNEETGEILSIVPVSGFIYRITTPEKVYNDYAGAVRYSFIINRDMLESLDFNCIGLYSDSKLVTDYNEYAALCSINVEKERATAASALLVDWELQISN